MPIWDIKHNSRDKTDAKALSEPKILIRSTMDSNAVGAVNIASGNTNARRRARCSLYGHFDNAFFICRNNITRSNYKG